MKKFFSQLDLIFLILIFGCLILISSCGNDQKQRNKSKDELSGTISISGAFALYPMTVRWAEEFQKLHPDVRIDISAGGAGKGMADALSQMVDLGMFSREVRQAEIDKGAWWIAVTKDAVLPTINANNPVIEQLKVKGLKRQQFIDIFLTEKIKTWGECADNDNNKKLNVFTRSDACGAAEMWGKYLGKNQESLNGVGVFGDPGMADAIKNNKNAIGYNNVIYIYDINSRKKYDGIEVIPIDLNENGKIDKKENFYATLDDIMKAIKKNVYPSPPARDLYFVSKGKPERKIVTEFLKWILENGQKYVKEAGYVRFSNKKIKAELEKL